MNPIPLHPTTQNELPSSQVFTGVKGHVTSPGPSHLSQSTSQCPYSGLQGPQHSGSSYLTCCSSVTPSAAHLRPRYLLFLVPGTLSTNPSKARSHSSIRPLSSEASPLHHTVPLYFSANRFTHLPFYLLLLSLLS